MTLVSRIVTPGSFPVQHHFDRPFLNDTFNKSIEKIKKIYWQIQAARDNPDLQKSLAIYALHYLAKGAKIPLHNTDKKVYLSFLEFLVNANPKYFRSQGGSIVSFYMRLLKTGEYRFLFKKYGTTKHPVSDHVFPVKSENFKHFLKLQHQCSIVPTNDDLTPEENEVNQLKHIREFSLPTSKKTSKKEKEESYFLDVSPLLSPDGDVPVGPVELEKRVKKIKEAVKKCKGKNANLIIGGFVQLNNGQHICILFNDHMVGADPALIKKQKKLIKEARAPSGYRPDIVKIRRAIVEDLGRRDEHLIEGLTSLYPAPRTPSGAVSAAVVEDLNPTAQFDTLTEHLFASLAALEGEGQGERFSAARKHYFQLFHLFLTTLRRSYQDKEEGLEPYAIQFISDSLEEVSAILNRIQEDKEMDYLLFLSEVDLLTEEIIYLLTILKPYDEGSFPQLLNEQGVKIEEPSIKSSYAFTSGMNSFAQVLGALRGEGERQNRKLKVGYSSTNYFELRLEVTPHIAKGFDLAKKAEDAFTGVKGDYDVFFMDIYPNEVTLPSVGRVDPIETITQLLHHRNGRPLTVVIDASTMLFSSEEIQKTVDKFKGEIDAGQLNIVVVNSLAKFSMCGLDKYTGGVVQTYNHPEAFEEFNGFLATRQQEEPLSPEAEQFFSLCFTEVPADAEMYPGGGAPTIIEMYLAEINENTEKLYQSLYPKLGKHRSKQRGQTPIFMTLTERESDKIPMLSFQFDNAVQALIQKKAIDPAKADRVKANIAILLKYYIYALAKLKGLPLDTRLSFGFAHSNINDCATALRLTVGLESEMLEAYKELFVEVNNELGKVLNNPLFHKLVMEEEDFFDKEFEKVDKRKKVIESVTTEKQDLESFLKNVHDVVVEPKKLQLQLKEIEPKLLKARSYFPKQLEELIKSSGIQDARVFFKFASNIQKTGKPADKSFAEAIRKATLAVFPLVGTKQSFLTCRRPIDIVMAVRNSKLKDPKDLLSIAGELHREGKRVLASLIRREVYKSFKLVGSPYEELKAQFLECVSAEEMTRIIKVSRIKNPAIFFDMADEMEDAYLDSADALREATSQLFPSYKPLKLPSPYEKLKADLLESESVEQMVQIIGNSQIKFRRALLELADEIQIKEEYPTLAEALRDAIPRLPDLI